MVRFADGHKIYKIYPTWAFLGNHIDPAGWVKGEQQFLNYNFQMVFVHCGTQLEMGEKCYIGNEFASNQPRNI